MLRFTQNQAAYINQQRSAFAANARDLSQRHNLTNGASLVGNAHTLPRDVWEQWDREAIAIQRDELAVFNNLAASVSAPMDIGKLVSLFMTVSDSGEVNESLDGRSKAKTDSPVYDYHGTPLPIIDTTFSFGWREMQAASTEGFNLAAAPRDNANRVIAEKLEDYALNGSDNISVGDSKLYGLRNHPKRSTRATGVTLNGATGAQWKAEFVALLKLLHANNYRVPATIYMNWDDWFYASETDFTGQYQSKSILQRLLEIEGVGEIVPAHRVPANELIGVVKRRQVIEILNGMPLTSRAKFRADPEDDYNFIVMAAAAPQIKFDAENQCGVAHSA